MSALAIDLRALAVACGDLRRRAAREHRREESRTARAALELAEAALRYAGHLLDADACGLHASPSPAIAREQIIRLAGVVIGAQESQ